MLRKLYKPTLTLALFIAGHASNAQNALNNAVWRDVSMETVDLSASTLSKNLSQFRLVELNLAVTEHWLRSAPMEFTPAAKTGGYILSLPTPTGDFKEFTIVESPMMEQGLADKYPAIKTYSAQGLQDKSSWAKIDVTPLGFHAMISTTNGVVFIDPVSLSNTQNYLVYYKQAIIAKPEFSCGVTETLEDVINNPSQINVTPQSLENTANKTTAAEIQLRKYRLALAATGEYTKTKGSTVDGALAGQVVSMNRVNGVYETELGIRLLLVNNNDKLIYTSSTTDPYTNNNGGTMLTENVTNVNKVIGTANYDIGHVFSTGGGGIAGLGVPCGASKARGVTGSPSPVGDAFDIDYVAHEMGHQFGGNHTFNSNTQGSCAGNRSTNAAYEPGSGITIMAYAGICGSDNVASNSIPYFHAKSLDEIMKFSQTAAGNTCAAKQSTGNFTPTVDAGMATVIPKGTPFMLKGSATDPDGDALTYSWEQFDLGPAGSPNTPSGNAPIFRPFAPSVQPVRVFPQWGDILGNKQTKGEILPSYARRMVFRLTARDNKIGGGGIGFDTVSVQVIDTIGPFKVTSQKDSIENWSEGQKRYITWDVSKTDLAPINCSYVRLKLSLDGGLTYPITLADSVPNSGMDSIIVPALNTNKARVMVQSGKNIFFDVTEKDIKIASSSFTVTSTTTKKTICITDTAAYTLKLNQFLAFADSIYLYADNVPNNLGVVFSENDVPSPATITVKMFKDGGAIAAGDYDILIKAISGNRSDSIPLKLTVVSEAPTATPTLIEPLNAAVNQILKPLFRWEPIVGAASYNIQLSTDPSFTTVLYKDSLITKNSYLFKGSFALQYGITYYWHVLAVNACGKGQYSSTFEFTTRNPSGISVNKANADVISLYPNPVNGDKLNIEINNNAQNVYQLKIYDLTGRLTKQETIKSNGNSIYSINVSEFQQGLYIVKLTNQTGNETIKKITIVK